MKKELELSYNEIKSIRKALHLLSMEIDTDLNEDYYYFVSDLYDKFDNLETECENELESQEEVED